MNLPSIDNQPVQTSGCIVKEFALSYGQKALFFVQQLTPQSAAHNIVYGVHLEGDFQFESFHKAYKQLAERHPALRTLFNTRDGVPIQRVYDRLDAEIELQDAQDWTRDQLNRALEKETYRPFDLTRGPLVRLKLFKQAPQRHLLLAVMHHIITDMWSMAIFIDEITRLYRANVTGQTAELKPVSGDYANYVAWQNDFLSGEEGQSLSSYWREKLAGMNPILNLAADFPRPPVQTDRGASAARHISAKQTRLLKETAKGLGVNLQTLCLAVFQTLLHRYTGQDDILMGYPKFGRRRDDARLIGYFINPVVLRSNFQGDPTFADLLKQTEKGLNEASGHDRFPFMLLVEQLQPVRDISRSPIFQVMFTWQKTTKLVEKDYMSSFAIRDEKGCLDIDILKLEPVSLPYRVEPFDLTLFMAESEDELVASLEYNTDLFETERIERMLDHFITLLQNVPRESDRPVSKLTYLTPEERTRLLVEWNPAPSVLHARCVQHLIEEQAARTPQEIAALYEDQSITYGELNRRANRLAHALIQRGVSANQVVGLFISRSIDVVIALLGILKAGGAYLPLDISYPDERLEYMLRDSQVNVLITQKDLVNRVPLDDLTLVVLDADPSATNAQNDANPATQPAPDDQAYVLYTSGSTGQPKGVMVSHQVIADHCRDMLQFFNLTANDHVLQFASLNFDPSLEQILTALMTGARVILRGDDLWDAVTFREKIKQYGLSVINITPPYWHQLAQSWAKENLPDEYDVLRLVIIGGDVVQMETVHLWHQTPMRKARLLNAYGPTEGTITAVVFEIPQDDTRLSSYRRIPIGRPLANRQAYILDKNLEPVPVGNPGELYLGGHLALGYLNQPQMTQEKFIPNPFSEQPGDRLYKTGDLVCFRPDGNIEFLGRVDHQTKVRGIRVELGEIESVLVDHPAVRDVFVTTREDSSGSNHLLAYIVPQTGQQPSTEVLRQAVKTKLPAYMVPSAFVFLDRLPLNTSGKVDRHQLPEPQAQSADAKKSFTPASSPLEKELAELWKKTLKIEQIGIHDSFFDLGGHSLLATQLISRVREAYHMDIPLRELFEQPTIFGMAESISQRLTALEDEDALNAMLDEIDGLSENQIRNLLEQEDLT